MIFPYYLSTLYFTLLESKRVQNYLKEGCKSMCAAFKRKEHVCFLREKTWAVIDPDM